MMNYFKISKGILLLLVGSFILTSCSLIFQDINPEKLAKAKRLCSKINVPNGFQKIRDFDINRPHATSFTTTYVTYSDSIDFEDFFRNNIPFSKGSEFAKESDLTLTELTLKERDWRVIVTIKKPLITKKKIVLISCSFAG